MSKTNTELAEVKKKGSKLWLIPAVLFSIITALILFWLFPIYLFNGASLWTLVEFFLVLIVPFGGLTALFYWLTFRTKKK